MEIDPRIQGSILEEEPPTTENFRERVTFCARVLAYGADKDLWTPRFKVGLQNQWYQSSNDNYSERFYQYFHDTYKTLSKRSRARLFRYYYWAGEYPRISFLEAFGYVVKVDQMRPTVTDIGGIASRITGKEYYDVYLLTEKAYALLDTPLTPPKVFISYRRGVSTVLGLLIEARLKALSSELNPYIDKFLEAGKPWETQLKKRIEDCSTFISLVGSEDSFSENVMNEIRWAMIAGKPIVSIWHGELNEIKPSLCPDDELADYLARHHAILVKGKEAIDYETAITLLENELHYF